jgi:heme/copper-type cytochrome/quinol oxidase subunit 4
MSDLKTAEHHDAPPGGHAEAHEHPVDFNSYLRRCVFIFIAILCATSLMIWISFLPEHYSWAAKVAMILAVAAANAFVVAGFLMHLLTEKKMIYTVLAFTVFFVIGLFALTLYAMKDFPPGTASH